ncbi:MAG: hypothetical protein Q7J34_08615 [Bacteroidales bacterium]|nr:hypothetical protein [Bacteroidales bacterium]
MKTKALVFILLSVVFWSCKPSMEAVKETKPLYTANAYEDVSQQEKQIIDNMIVRRLDVINQQKNAEQASDEGGQQNVSLDDINRKLKSIDMEIANYLNTPAREVYYKNAWQKAVSGL